MVFFNIFTCDVEFEMVYLILSHFEKENKIRLDCFWSCIIKGDM
jgi:hypothetical protein